MRISLFGIRQRPILPGRFQPSTFGTEGLNFCVRDGNRCDPFVIATGNCELVLPLSSPRLSSALSASRRSGVPRLRARAEGFPVALCTPSGRSYSSFPSRVLWVSFVMRLFPHPDNCTGRDSVSYSADLFCCFLFSFQRPFSLVSVSRAKSSPRPISIIKLHTLLRFHR